MAKKQQKDERGGTLGEIAAGLGSLLGNAEKQWRAWQGPRDTIVSAVTDVRDRAAALLVEMGVPDALSRGKDARDAAAGEADEKTAKKEKKKDKAARKAEKKAKKAEKVEKTEKAEKASGNKAATDAKDASGKKAKKGKKKGKKAGDVQ